MKLKDITEAFRFKDKVYHFMVKHRGYAGNHPLDPEFKNQNIYEFPLGKGIMSGSVCMD